MIRHSTRPSRPRESAFRAAMDDDLNVSGGLGAVFDLVRDLNRRVDARSLSTADARRGAAALRDFDTVLARGRRRPGAARRRAGVARASGSLRVPRATLALPTGCVMNYRRWEWRWKTRVTASAGVSLGGRPMADDRGPRGDRPDRDRAPRPDRRRGSADWQRRSGRPGARSGPPGVAAKAGWWRWWRWSRRLPWRWWWRWLPWRR